MKQQKQYREENKLMIAKRNKEYRDKHKEKIDELSRSYRETHKMEKTEYDKLYRDKNKDMIRERNSKDCICECGKHYTHNHKSRHTRTKYHEKWLKTNSTN